MDSIKVREGAVSRAVQDRFVVVDRRRLKPYTQGGAAGQTPHVRRNPNPGGAGAVIGRYTVRC